MEPIPIVIRELTGNMRGRPGWFGKYIFQVENRCTSYKAYDYKLENPIASWLKWFDATWEDVQNLPK